MRGKQYEKINIGLDLGIASVGWAVVNAEAFEILDAGVRLFPEANKEGENTATTRREKRSIRRMKRRRQLRLFELKQLFVKYKMLETTKAFENLKNKRFPTSTELKCYALESPISLEGMMLILFSSLKKRGSFNLKEDLLESEEEKLSEEEIEKIVKEQNSKFPCLIQLENLKTKNKIVGSENKFAHEMYKKELEAIINKQLELKSFMLEKQFVQEYFQLFDRKREYFEGPSNPSLFSWNQDEEEFYNRLIGKDTYDRNENRTAKHGMYAALFNILNDLNQIEIHAENRQSKKITKEEKETIINSLFSNLDKKNKKLTLKMLAKFLDTTEDKISGYRIDKSGKANFTKFEGLIDIYNKLNKAELDTQWLKYENIELIDEILNVLTKYQSMDSAKTNLSIVLKNQKIENNDKVADVLSTLVKNTTGLTLWVKKPS